MIRSKQRFVGWRIISILGITVIAQPAQAVPLGTAFTYQGQLKNAGGPASGLHDLRFLLYDAVTLGAPVGAFVCIDNVNVVGGLFTVPLDFGAQFSGQERYLEIEVRVDTGLNCANSTGFAILTPRQALTAAPNALFASNADLFDGLNSTAFLTSVPVPLTLSGTGATHIIRSENASTTGGSYGVLGYATASTGATYGVYGLSSSTSGLGVLGLASAGNGTTYGVFGESYSTDGTGVHGSATAVTGPSYGVFGQSSSTGGQGVVGVASANTGVTFGVHGVSTSPTGRGVFGHCFGTGNISSHGVHGRSDSLSGYDFWAGGVGLDYGAPSSKRWKSHIEPIGQPLDKLGRLRGVYFNWDAEHGGQHDVGMIAEEVGAVLPEIVNYEENGIDANGMDYSKMTPLLVEAVNSLRAEKDDEIAHLRAETDAQIMKQEKRISELVARLERLEKSIILARP